jgi:hypothetical protein
LQNVLTGWDQGLFEFCVETALPPLCTNRCENIPGDVVFRSMNSTSHTAGWRSSSANTLTVDTSNKKEGAAALKSVGSGTSRFQKRTPSNTDVNIVDQHYLTFWYYINDVTALTGEGQVEIGSGGTYDQHELNWSINQIGLVNGWNYVKLPLARAKVRRGPVDYRNINWFRIYHQIRPGRSATTRIDHIVFTNK